VWPHLLEPLENNVSVVFAGTQKKDDGSSQDGPSFTS
jgi:hypothetical protein